MPIPSGFQNPFRAGALERLMLVHSAMSCVRASDPGNERIGKWGISMGRFIATHCLRRRAPRKRQSRRLSLTVVALSAILAIAVAVIPARMAFAEQVLELPQTAAPSPTSDSSIESASLAESPHRSVAPMPAGLGTIDDYEAEGSSSPYSAGSGAPSGNAPVERRASQNTLTNEVVVGALVLGVLAMELHAAHQHR